jgi:hypothetical protein
VELFDYRVGEVSYVDEGANLLPFLTLKNLKRDDVKKEAFQALLKTEVKNTDQVVEILKRAEVKDDDQEAIKNVLKVLTGLTKVKSLSQKTLGDVLAAAELADLTGEPSEHHKKVKGAFDYIAEKVAVKISKALDLEDGKADMGEANAKPKTVEEQEKNKANDDGDDEDEDEKDKTFGSSDDKEDDADEAEKVNKRKGGNAMDLSKLPLTKDGDLDVEVLKKAKMDAGTINVVKSLWEQNRNLTGTLDKVNEKLNNEVELRVDKHYEIEADVFKSLKFEGLKDVLKKFGTACPDEYPKLKSLLTVAADAMKPAANQDFTPVGGARGGVTPSEPTEFYNVCKRKAVEMFKDENPSIALQKYFQTPEGRKDYGTYDRMVTNK